MGEWFRKLRYKLAYLLAPDWIEDLEYRRSCLLCEATRGQLSNCYYPLPVMLDAVHDVRMRTCEDCEYYIWLQQSGCIGGNGDG
jgi:hypothetical protein